MGFPGKQPKIGQAGMRRQLTVVTLDFNAIRTTAFDAASGLGALSVSELRRLRGVH